MPIGKIEFVLVVSISSAFIIFTPEPLVLLRNLCLWALFPYIAWHGYDSWESFPTIRDVFPAIVTPCGLLLDKLFGVVRCARTTIGRIQDSWARTTTRIHQFPRAFLSWVKARVIPHETREPPISESRPIPKPQEYYSLLVTTPPIHTYGPISDLISRTPDTPYPVPWEARRTDCLPAISERLAFRRHFAICLIRTDLWDDENTTLIQKLDGQLFWDHCGNEKRGAMESIWTTEKILKINGIQKIGVVSTEGDAVELCTTLYLQLRKGWIYFNIWWNDADFALILSYLLVGDAAGPVCITLLEHLSNLRVSEVTDPRAVVGGKNFLGGAIVGVGSAVLTAATGGLAFPLVLGSLGWAAGSSVSMAITQTGEQNRLRLRQRYCAELQELFPQLRKLFCAG